MYVFYPSTITISWDGEMRPIIVGGCGYTDAQGLEQGVAYISSSRCLGETWQINISGRPPRNGDFKDGLATWRGGYGQRPKRQAVRSRPMIGRHAAHKSVTALLYFAKGVRWWVFGLFLPLSIQNNEKLKAEAGHMFSSGDRMDAKWIPSSIESTAFEEIELIEIHMSNIA